jgi:hypothetical protein
MQNATVAKQEKRSLGVLARLVLPEQADRIPCKFGIHLLVTAVAIPVEIGNTNQSFYQIAAVTFQNHE